VDSSVPIGWSVRFLRELRSLRCVRCVRCVALDANPALLTHSLTTHSYSKNIWFWFLFTISPFIYWLKYAVGVQHKAWN